ncbi:MAG: PQQ-dependent dehydrogenase, methanol/ethanol family [Sphingomonadales bacterium]|nr:PQQ-dependent dehydrogenase, methanol/ethanol family [Sphingomonadales bacterium]
MLAGGLPGKTPLPAPTTEWPAVNGNSDETGFSPLRQIDRATVGHLGLAWALDLPGETSLEAAPLEIGGKLFFTGSRARVYAVDALSGKIVWSFDPKTWQYNPEKMGWANRGLAYATGRIFFAANDGRLFALDARTGRQIWAVDTTDRNRDQIVTGVPRLFYGMVVIGQGGADSGARGFVTAYDQASGRQVWRFHVVPGSPEQNRGDPAMAAAAKTWAPDFWKKTGGGGGPWDSITYDKALDRLYVGTANASPYDPDARSPGGGDNLYTASIVALDAKSGKYLWHYQLNPRDSWDFDATQQMVLATLTIDGRARRVLMQAPKNGFFYVIDRDTGKPISAGKIGKVNWADRIDPVTGRPVELAGIRYESGESVIYPFSSGAHSFMRMAYDPATGLVYVPVMQAATRFRRGAPIADNVFVGGLNIGEHVSEPGDNKGTLVAWDPVAQKPRWTVQHPFIWNGGTLATAGGLVFQGDASGRLAAYDAATGKELWGVDAGMGIIASPVTYAIGGRQYVSVLAGYGASAAILSDIMNVGWKYASPRRLLTFALGGHAALPPSPPRSLAISAQDNPEEKLDPRAVAVGQGYFMACAVCHGRSAVGAGGPAPDLRESPIPLDRDAFMAVVQGGALKERGMPAFSQFPPDVLEGIRQYIRSRGRAALARK